MQEVQTLFFSLARPTLTFFYKYVFIVSFVCKEGCSTILRSNHLVRLFGKKRAEQVSGRIIDRINQWCKSKAKLWIAISEIFPLRFTVHSFQQITLSKSIQNLHYLNENGMSLKTNSRSCNSLWHFICGTPPARRSHESNLFPNEPFASPALNVNTNTPRAPPARVTK